MTAERVRLALRLTAALDALVGVLLVLSTWDGLYNKLELPKPSPALPAQVAGFGVVALAYLLWAASRDAALVRTIATAGAGMNAGAALVILFWLVFRNENDLLIIRGGKSAAHVSRPLLGVLAAVLAVCALALAVAALRRDPQQAP